MVVVGINMGVTQSGMKLNDGGCCLIKDNKIYAIAEERISRKKNDGGYKLSLPYCMDAANVSYEEIDYVVISSCCEKTLSIKPVIENIPDEKIIICPSHHLSHAYSTFMTSNFDEAIIMVIDNEGNIIDDCDDLPFHQRSLEHMTYYIGNKTGIHLLEKDNVPTNKIGVGDAYRYFTHYLGFPSYTYAGKTMGLASYGDKDKYEDVKIFELNHGHFRCEIDNDYFNCAEMVNKFLKENCKQSYPTKRLPIDDLSKEHADLAMLIQRETEQILVEKAKYLVNKTGIKRLCIAGGVGLNSVANAAILNKTDIEEIYIVPAAGDSGQCLGNALYGYCKNEGHEKHYSINNSYLGKEYSENDICDAVKKFQKTHVNYEIYYFENKAEQNKVIAHKISDGEVLCNFDGRSEFGPRALGNRSILMDPRKAENKDILNSRVKFREAFRPFAPVVLWENAKEYFDISKETPYMLIVADVIKPEKIPAVTHVDNSARVQTIKRVDNPKLYGIIEEFKKITGVPVLLNTSFNIAGEPMVERPEDALSCFEKTDIDSIAIGKFIISKKEKNIMTEFDAIVKFTIDLGKNL